MSDTSSHSSGPSTPRADRTSEVPLEAPRKLFPRFVVGAVFFVTVGFTVSGARLAERARVEQRRSDAYALGSERAARVTQLLSGALLATREAEAGAASRTSVGDLRLFNLDLAAEMQRSPELRNAVQQIPRNGLGTLVGPLELPGLDPVVVGLSPSSEGDWSAVAVQVPDLVEAAGFDAIAEAGLGYVLRTSSATGSLEGGALVRSNPEPLPAPLELPVSVADTRWALQVGRPEGWNTPMILWPSVLAAVLAAFIAALLTDTILRRPDDVERRLGEEVARIRRVNQDLLRQIERQRKIESELSFRAAHDELTGLPLRSHLTDRLERALVRTRSADDYGVAVICLGLDRFKFVNDSLGREAGDDVLRTVAYRLDRALRPGDTLARAGGDQFAAVLYGVREIEVAEEVAKRVREVATEGIVIGGQELFLTCSLGLAHTISGFEQPTTLLRQAETAMYAAKEMERGGTAVFDSAREEQAADVVHLEAEIRKALREESFQLAFHPVVAVGSGEVVGAEVLTRWTHALEGEISPHRFISVAEESRLIIELDRWVLRRAAEQLREWKTQGTVGADFYLSVNLSGRHIGEPDLVDFVQATLHETGTAPGSLCLEVTEGVLLSRPHVALRILKEIRDMGVRLFLDDFGTGYSSISYLHRFPFDVLKVDRSFIRGLPGDEREESVVRAIVGLAKSFGLKTVAEGPERRAQIEVLEKLGCDYTQGFMPTPPLKADALESFLASYGGSKPTRTALETSLVGSSED